MPTSHSLKSAASASSAPHKGTARKAATLDEASSAFDGWAGRGRSAYSFEGDVGDLARALEDSHVGAGFRTVVIAETSEAERALKKAALFRVFRTGRRAASTAAPQDAGDGGQSSPAAVESAGPAVTADPDLLQFDDPTSKVGGAGRVEDAYRPSARARAILRGREYAEADLRAAGGAFDVDQVRKLLNGVSRQAVDKRVADGSLLVVPGPSGHRRFPTLQFNVDGTPVAGLREVQKALDFGSAWAVLNFLCNANDQLGGRAPIDVLRDGALDRVVQAAAGVGVQGA